ncbi:hypothetical protein GCM10009792_01990 [Microcella alkalica]|uniref:G3E family GTPase n=1 Tax=Microcella alkalica TaxID=355930 RepID=A0A839E5J5_9MICO|nr:GTP-binding protein [Microcella alkalica]MBA8847939.1 G3E family GTPase [Microcella alkalica]
MQPVDVIAVVGACAAERAAYAQRLASATGRGILRAARLSSEDDPLTAAADLAPGMATRSGLVIELPAETAAHDLLGALATADASTRLMGLVCVADAAHLLRDLQRDDYIARPAREHPHPDADADADAGGDDEAGHGAPGRIEHTARAQLAVTQLEFASSIVLVNWSALSTPELATTMALVAHLSPRARLRLDRRDLDVRTLLFAHSPAHDGAGWVRLLNGAFDPHMTDRRVSALHWEQARPLHPERLQRLLDDRVEPGELGTIVRSAGFCRFATRPGITALWDHVGRTISLAPLAHDGTLSPDDEPLALGQDLAIIGLDLDHAGLRAAFDAAALTDDELLAGPETWAGFRDPFPVWPAAMRE